MERFAFKGPGYLTDFNLSVNFIQVIYKEFFEDMSLLENLDLSFNNIRIIEDFSFTEQKYLKELSLFNNSNLRSISSTRTFANLPSLKHMKLDRELFDSVESLARLKDSLRPVFIKQNLAQGLVYFSSIYISFWPRHL